MKDIFFNIIISLFLIVLIGGSGAFLYLRLLFISKHYRILKNNNVGKFKYFVPPDILNYKKIKNDDNESEVDEVEKLRKYSIYVILSTFILIFLLSLILIIFFPEYNELK